MPKKKLRIAQIAPLAESIPPKKYGGTERVIHALSEELVRRGHDVTVFASGDSKTSAKLVSVYPKALREAKIKDIYGPNEITLLNIGLAYQMQKEFDVIHDHLSPFSIPTANLSQTPAVMTMHGPFTARNRRLFETLKNMRVVGISKSQMETAYNLDIKDVVYNGLKMSNFTFSQTSEGYLLFVGRITMDKGVHLAIEVAQELNMPLIIAAKLDDIDLKYFHEYVESKLTGDIRWIGEVDEEERNKLMSKALCLLMPIIWREPFGLTAIEAQACGCPVIAFRNGSLPEIIMDGKTGFVVDDVEEMINAVTKVNKINRADCREFALKNFNEKAMADGYEKIYYEEVGK